MPLTTSGLKPGPASTLVTWDSSYSVYVTEIDRQHQTLFFMINELSNSISQDKGPQALAKSLDDMAVYTGEHIATEERLFDKYSYPWSGSHKAEHQIFTQRVSAIIQEYKQGKSGLNHQIISCWSDWLKNHIVAKDKTYSYFFVMKGLN
jgi:hemerythrin-like metal-binding protein